MDLTNQMPIATKSSKIDISLEKNTVSISKKFSNFIRKGDIIFFYGEIGVGKTTFTRYLINNLQSLKGLKETEVLSPTFNLLYEYEIKDLKIMHYDLYRIKKTKELDYLGIFSENKKTIKIIEWPDLIKTPLANKLEINLKYGENDKERKMEINGVNKWKDFENEI